MSEEQTADETVETVTEDVAEGQETAGDESAEKGAAKDAEPRKTAMEGGGAEDAKAPQTWPDDWRQQAAGEDEKMLKRLDRYKSPAEVAKALVETQDKLRSGQERSIPGKDATDEEIAEYRKANGIPEKPDGYLESLKGITIGEEDQELVNSFLEDAHAQNAPPGSVHAALQWWKANEEKAIADQHVADEKVRSNTVEELRQEWGNEYKPNIQSALNWLESAPALPDGTPLKQALLNARMGDGTLLGDNATALRWLVGMAKDANPAGFMSPSESTSQIDGVKSELENIRTVMREDRKRYNADTAMQERYRKLLDAEQKLSAS